MADNVDVGQLEREVKQVYRSVATHPEEDRHFEMGRQLAERLGYRSADLDRVPDGALESFAGVGYHLDGADFEPGNVVVDLGSGSGTDAFIAAGYVGESGRVVGIDMTHEQIDKARAHRDAGGFESVTFEHGYIESLPFDADSADVVISNGVINLSADKPAVFAEASRILRSDGRLAVADIVSEEPMPTSITSNADLWAACIGGAMQVDRYRELIEESGFRIESMTENPEYEFRSKQAADACEKYGVKSISLAARAV